MWRIWHVNVLITTFTIFYLLLLLSLSLIVVVIIIVLIYCISIIYYFLMVHFIAKICSQINLVFIIDWFGVSLVCFPALIIHGVQTKFQFNPRTDFICNTYKPFVEARVAEQFLPRTLDLEVWGSSLAVGLFP